MIAARFYRPLKTPFFFLVIMLDKFGHDAGHQGFELLVPSVFFRIQYTMAMNNPPHVSWSMRTEKIWSFMLRLGAECS